MKKEIKDNKGICIIPKNIKSMKEFTNKCRDWIEGFTEGYKVGNQETLKEFSEKLEKANNKMYEETGVRLDINKIKKEIEK